MAQSIFVDPVATSGFKVSAGIGTGLAVVGGILSGSVSTTVTGNGADVTEDTLYTYTLPANTLNANNKGVRIVAAGTLANNSDSKTYRLYFGSAIVGSGTTTGANVSWRATADVFRSAAGAQIFSGQGYASTSIQSQSTSTTNSDETQPIVIKVTGQAGAATANDIVFKLGFVEALNC